MLLNKTLNWINSFSLPWSWRKKRKEQGHAEGQEEKVMEAKPAEQRHWLGLWSGILAGQVHHPGNVCSEIEGDQQKHWLGLWSRSSSRTVNAGEPEQQRAHWLGLWSSSSLTGGGGHNPGGSDGETENPLLPNTPATKARLDCSSPEHFEICFNFIRHLFDLFVIGFLGLCSPIFKILLDIVSIQGMLKLWLHGMAMFLVATYGMALVLWVVQAYIVQFSCFFGLLQILVLSVSIRNQMETMVTAGEEGQQPDPPSSEKEASDFEEK